MDLALRDQVVLVTGSPLSSWTTGQVVSVNGGYAMV
jgi:hypothetical protein